nr:hypothetical protein [uncultured Albidiferax sp.]
MASIENRSRYTVTVKNRDDLTQEFPFNKSKAIQAYIAKLGEQGFKPKLSQAENLFLVRIRQKGYDEDQVVRNSREEADAYIKTIEEERHRGLFIDYTAAHKTSFASVLVRHLEEEVPKLKSSRYLPSIKVEGWLEDSGPEGVKMLAAYREGLEAKNVARRPAKHKMREVSTYLAWIHKRLSEVTTSDIEDYSAERLLSVMPATVDREFAARRPRYFNERDRRITPEEERQLIDALAAIDRERAVQTALAPLQAIRRRNPCPEYPASPSLSRRFCDLHHVGGALIAVRTPTFSKTISHVSTPRLLSVWQHVQGIRLGKPIRHPAR